MILGCIADDFTGATDLANMLAKSGLRTVQVIGVPSGRAYPDADAIVVALKSRTAPAAEAVAQSLAALAWLRRGGCRQFFFKYCSTFDSTARGNIGPVSVALMEALDAAFTIACPAFPENGRTVYRGHLFVGDVLLSESGMQHHPLTPMADANLVRVLQAQSAGHQVGLVRYDVVAEGEDAIRARFAELRAAGIAMAIVDALSDRDLHAIGKACDSLPLLTGGSGVALGLAQNYRARGWLGENAQAAELPPVAGLAAVLSGSCSRATNGQVAQWRKTRPAFRVDPFRLAAGADVAAEALAWALPQLAAGPVLVYATSEPDEVKKVQTELGVERAGQFIEQCLARLARDLVGAGVRRLVVAGGETSGAVVSALAIDSLRIGPQIDPGVPWTLSLSEPQMLLALKSGNFGGADFFAKALDMVA